MRQVLVSTAKLVGLRLAGPTHSWEHTRMNPGMAFEYASTRVDGSESPTGALVLSLTGFIDDLPPLATDM